MAETIILAVRDLFVFTRREFNNTTRFFFNQRGTKILNILQS